MLSSEDAHHKLLASVILLAGGGLLPVQVGALDRGKTIMQVMSIMMKIM